MVLVEGGHETKFMTDYTTWTDGGTGSVTGFTQNGANQNRQLYGIDPWGRTTVVWEAVPTGNDGASGGWYTANPYVNIDINQLYRYSVWVNRTIQGGTTPGVDEGGAFYFGLRNYTNTTMITAIRVNDDTATTNPYFYVTANPPESALPTGEWILVVAHVFPHDWTDTSNHADSGRYKTTGYYGAITYDWKWNPLANRGGHRSYLYYNEDATARQRWCYPRVDIIDGTEPTIPQLLSGNYYDPAYDNNVSHIGRNSIVVSSNFSEVGPVDGLAAYWPLNGNMLEYSGNGYHGETGSSIEDVERTVASVVDGLAPRDKGCYYFPDSAAVDIIGIGTANERYITCADSAAWSWSCWIYKTIAYGNDGIGGHWEQYNGAEPAGRLSFINTTTIHGYFATPGTNATMVRSSGTWILDEWWHLVITHTTGNVYKTYENGIEVCTMTAAGTINFNRIGRNPEVSGWASLDGYMMDFRIYNKVLEAKEIIILSNTFDTDAANRIEMEVGANTWYTFGQFKEGL